MWLELTCVQVTSNLHIWFVVQPCSGFTSWGCPPFDTEGTFHQKKKKKISLKSHINSQTKEMKVFIMCAHCIAVAMEIWLQWCDKCFGISAKLSLLSVSISSFAVVYSFMCTRTHSEDSWCVCITVYTGGFNHSSQELRLTTLPTMCISLKGVCRVGMSFTSYSGQLSEWAVTGALKKRVITWRLNMVEGVGTISVRLYIQSQTDGHAYRSYAKVCQNLKGYQRTM